jgi:2-polyprenyl-6-methoxyphenol hydroxylase-like FAD-dependent oxidoreductase
MVDNGKLRICVVGAGIAGLTFAQVLLKRIVGVHLIIYERDAPRSARTQGGSLDLKADGGQIALKLAGLFDEFQRLMRRDGQEMKVMLPNGKILMHHAEPEEDQEDFNPEIDRGQLRTMFLDRLDSHIRWGTHVISVELDAANSESTLHGYRVTLADGLTESFDLVIGADGCFSRVRSLLSDVKPAYTGYTFTECYLTDVAQRYPTLNALVGPGTLMIPATGGKAIIAQQNGDGRLRIGAVLQVPEDWHRTNGFPWEHDPRTTRELLLEYYISKGVLTPDSDTISPPRCGSADSPSIKNFTFQQMVLGFVGSHQVV